MIPSTGTGNGIPTNRGANKMIWLNKEIEQEVYPHLRLPITQSKLIPPCHPLENLPHILLAWIKICHIHVPLTTLRATTNSYIIFFMQAWVELAGVEYIQSIYLHGIKGSTKGFWLICNDTEVVVAVLTAAWQQIHQRILMLSLSLSLSLSYSLVHILLCHNVFCYCTK
jgi:hypothetical protein